MSDAHQVSPLAPPSLFSVSTSVLLSLLAAENASADLLHDAKTLRPTLGAKYEQMYAHVEIHTVDTDVEGGQGKHNFQRSCTYYRNGDWFKKLTTTLRSGLPGMNVGGEGVLSASPDYYFQLSRDSVTSPYILQEFRQLSGDDDHPERDACRPLFASAYLDRERIDDLLAGNNPLPLVGAEKVTFEGKSLVMVTVELKMEGGAHENWYLYFLPDSWAFAGATRTVGDIVLESRVTYDHDDPLKLQSFRRWQRLVKIPQTKQKELDVQVSSVRFRDVPLTEFRLAFYGLEEPATPHAARTRLKYVWTTAGIFSVLFALLYLRTRRRSRT